MSKKRYRPKQQDKPKSGGHSGNGKPAPDPDAARDSFAKLFAFPNANEDVENRKQAILEAAEEFNNHTKTTSAAAGRERQQRQVESARATAAKAAKVISEQGADTQQARESGKTGELDKWLAGLSDEELKGWRKMGENIHDTLQFSMGGVSALGSGPLSDEEVIEYLGNGVRFLNQVVVLTSVVLDTIDVEYMRKVVARDSQPLSMQRALKALGYDPEKLLGGGVSADTQEDKPKSGNHRKLPRGRRHPLIQLTRWRRLRCA